MKKIVSRELDKTRHVIVERYYYDDDEWVEVRISSYWTFVEFALHKEELEMVIDMLKESQKWLR